MHHDIVAFKYWNTNGLPVAIVAVEGAAHDVAAYIGGDPQADNTSESTLRWVAGYGAKLTREEAFRFLPQLAECGLIYRD